MYLVAVRTEEAELGTIFFAGDQSPEELLVVALAAFAGAPAMDMVELEHSRVGMPAGGAASSVEA
jgi:hypothetical protein